MKSITNAILLGILIVFLGGSIAGFMLWNKGPLQTEDMVPNLVYTPEEFLQQFLSGKEEEVTKRLTNQIIQINGIGTFVKTQNTILFKTSSGEIDCELSKGTSSDFEDGKNRSFMIKGSFVGYESLIDPTISMNNCNPVK